MLHGTDGEDGSIQGMLQSVNIPFAGSGVLGSSVAMDKLMSKQLLSAEGIPTSKFVALTGQKHWEGLPYEQIIDSIGSPLHG